MSQPAVQVRRYTLPTATLGETACVLAAVVAPVIARGVIVRRPWVVGLVERLDLDTRAVRRMRALRDKYGPGPLRLKVPVRQQTLILHPDHVHQVLEGTPEPFAAASLEKQTALAHFQPQGVLISHGDERTDRRRFNEAVLDTDRTVHRLAEHFVGVVDEEARHLLDDAQVDGELAWNPFFYRWMRVVRRVTLGDGAADDHELTDLIAALRSDANWAFARPKRTDLRDQFYARLEPHLERAEPGSLAWMMAGTAKTPRTEPAQQVPQWLFAFDPAGMATFRALALLASHPLQAERTRVEMRQPQNALARDFPLLRAAILEALRLWPTTPMVLRETTMPVLWENGMMPANTNILIHAPFFHRDDANLPYAHRFAPDIWMGEPEEQKWPLIPFSAGPAGCPGRNLVLLIGSAMLANILEAGDIRLASHPKIKPGVDLPGTLNNYGLRFSL